MRKVARKAIGRKSEVSVVSVAATEGLDAKVEMIQALIPLGLERESIPFFVEM
jgi:hypothetical protein